ncbi:MAG: MBL fold metallo-hydrolase [bacterium]
MSLLLKQYEIGPMENFVYFVGDADTREVFVVDPAWEVDTIFKRAQEEDLKIVGALISHHHHDHTNGIPELLERQDVPVYIHKNDAPYVRVPRSTFTEVDQGDHVNVGDVRIDFLHTPGHTPGSQCFRVRNGLISGDTLFIRGCGRCDFPGGDAEQMYYTLTQKIMRLPDEVILYPGHNYAEVPTSTMADEKARNPYLKMASLSLKDFLKLRMGR